MLKRKLVEVLPRIPEVYLACFAGAVVGRNDRPPGTGQARGRSMSGLRVFERARLKPQSLKIVEDQEYYFIPGLLLNSLFRGSFLL